MLDRVLRNPHARASLSSNRRGLTAFSNWAAARGATLSSSRRPASKFTSSTMRKTGSTPFSARRHRRRSPVASLLRSTTCGNLRQPLPIPDGAFDACYSHMLSCMAFKVAELEALSCEILPVLRPGGLCIFTVRNTSHRPGQEFGARHRPHGVGWQRRADINTSAQGADDLTPVVRCLAAGRTRVTLARSCARGVRVAREPHLRRNTLQQNRCSAPDGVR